MVAPFAAPRIRDFPSYAPSMGLEIKPQPTAQEREAIERALRKLIAGRSVPAAYESAWRQAGLREAVEGGPGLARTA
jgi:hypothetical protein